MFGKILIANRGEVAVRIIRTARRLGVKTVLAASEADRDSLAADMADETIIIGPAPAALSYLVIDNIIAAAKSSGAGAVHPGFGFLSENADFADRLVAENIVFIGPNAHAIRAMGDKIESKRRAAAAGVACVPGFVGAIESSKHAFKIAEEIGYPVMLKASAGGGGKGIRVATNWKEVEEGFPAVRAEAKAAFGDDRILIEKFITAPRHIEIQVLGDKHGALVHLNERDCSIQRRNQKVIEEAPSPLLDEATRAAMGAAALALAKAVNYDSAGTVEFVASASDRRFFFLEMNTRLQVEHPVTEMITGVDLVEQMIRVAAGEKLGLKQKDLAPKGWAIESRIYAEDPRRNFLPSIGRLKRFDPPKQSAVVRVDSGVRAGDEISIHYDPMIAKLITQGEDRAAAIEAQARALDEFLIDGPKHNIAFLGAVMGEHDFRKGAITTAYIKHHFPDGFEGSAPSEEQARLLIACAAYAQAVAARRAGGGRSDWVVIIASAHQSVDVMLDPAGGVVSIGAKRARLDTSWRPGQALMRGVFDGAAFAVKIAPVREGYALELRGVSLTALVASPRGAELHKRLPEKPKADTSKFIVSPMPGLVVSLSAARGQKVIAGESVAVVEAMKMQNIIRAERDGVVAKVNVAPGASVAADEVLIELA